MNYSIRLPSPKLKNEHVRFTRDDEALETNIILIFILTDCRLFYNIIHSDKCPVKGFY